MVDDVTQRLRAAIYEFRERAQRIPPTAPERVQRAVEVSSPAAGTSPAAAARETGEVPDYVPPSQRGEELVTYWLYYGAECVGTKRMPVGTGAVDVRNAALREAVIFCDRANGEIPIERETKIRHSTVKVYDDRAAQESMRRKLPFEQRGLFPGELPFLEIGFRCPMTSPDLTVHVWDVTFGLQTVALAEGLKLNAMPRLGAGRTVRIESADREALGRVEFAMKEYLAESGAELVLEFGVGYVRAAAPAQESLEDQSETETERPRG
jgi:hypothetical protein